ncbi:hypothetical protein D9M71_501200 [compost metagenome]
MRRQRHLALGTEQAFGAELFLQGIEGQAQRAIASRLHGVEDQLIITAPLEQRDLATHLDRQAVFQGLANPCRVLPEQRATHLGAAVLEGEIDVAGSRAGEVGDFAFDPDVAEHVFKQHPRAAVELADGQDFAVQAESCKGIFNHGAQFKGICLAISTTAHKSIEGIYVGASLLAMGPANSALMCQTDRHREQARSHRGKVASCDQGRCSDECV